MPDSKTINPPQEDSAGKKKKKRNRKKKSKQSTDDAASNASSLDGGLPLPPPPQAPKAPTAMINPHEKMRKDLLNEGFSEKQVDQAMEEMWDKNLPYDEFESVLKYLKGEKESGTEKTKKETTKVKTKAETKKEEVVEEKQIESVPMAQKDPPAKPASPPMSMEERLEMVANFENLSDAIFALTEWISKAAKPNDLEDLCAARKTKALITVFRRSITESTDQPKFQNLVSPSMVRLIDSLLRKSGIAADGIAETQRTFETLLQQARKTFMLEPPDAQDFAERVSRFIVSRISFAIGESNSPLETGEMPNTAAQSSLPASMVDAGIAGILSEREVHRTAAKRSGVSVRSLFGGAEAGEAVGNGGSRETEISTSDIMLALVGEDTKESFELQRADLDELKAQAKDKETPRVSELKETIEDTRVEREGIAQRIAELKHKIEKLETYDAELCVKMNDTKAQLDKEVALVSVEAASLNEKIKEVSDSMKYYTSVYSVIDNLKKYDDSLDKAMQKSAGSVPINTNGSGENLARQMERYISHAASYFKCEAEAVRSLQKRIEANSKAINELKVEIIELEGLGLSTTIEQMKDSIEKKEKMIPADMTTKQRFIGEAAAMFEALVHRLEEYSASNYEKGFNSTTVDHLSSIRIHAAALGIAAPDRLNSFATNGIGSLRNEAANLTSSIESIIGDTQPSATLKAPVPIVSGPGGAAPKLTWASAKVDNDSASASKPSLLDIQKEELQSKETS